VLLFVPGFVTTSYVVPNPRIEHDCATPAAVQLIDERVAVLINEVVRYNLSIKNVEVRPMQNGESRHSRERRVGKDDATEIRWDPFARCDGLELGDGIPHPAFVEYFDVVTHEDVVVAATLPRKMRTSPPEFADVSFRECVRLHVNIRKPFSNKNVASLAAVWGQQCVVVVNGKIDANVELGSAEFVPIAPSRAEERPCKLPEALEALSRVCGTPGSDGKEYGEHDRLLPEFD